MRVGPDRLGRAWPAPQRRLLEIGVAVADSLDGDGGGFLVAATGLEVFGHLVNPRMGHQCEAT